MALDSSVKCNKNEWDGRIVIAGTAKGWELSAMAHGCHSFQAQGLFHQTPWARKTTVRSKQQWQVGSPPATNEAKLSISNR